MSRVSIPFPADGGGTRGGTFRAMEDPGALEDPPHDVAIVGAGVSGLTLAWLLMASGAAGSSILLVDGARDDDELRTLSFWAAGPSPLDPLVVHRWDTLRLYPDRDDDTPHDVPLVDHTYRSVFLADLQREVKARMAARPGDLVVDGRLHDLRPDGDGVRLVVGARTFRARWVFDSRFHPRDLVVDTRHRHDLRQFFHGRLLRAHRDAFAPGTATLLDFRVDVPAGTGFAYVLPFSPREALVELVTLHPVDAEPLLRTYLRRATGLDLDAGDADLLDRESGVSPMTEQPFGWHDGDRVRRIGIAAGRLKPSTGYAVTRIVEDSRRIVAALERGRSPLVPPPGGPGHRLFHRLLDAVLLEVWQHRPEAIPPAFAAMFLRNPPDAVLRFLDERARPAEMVRLVATLPKRPFLHAVARLTARRLTGH